MNDHLIHVITFQMGQTYFGDSNKFCVFIGIRVPECVSKSFADPEPVLRFYDYADCNIVVPVNHHALGYKGYLCSNGVSYNSKMFMLDAEDIQPVIDELSETIEQLILPFFNNMDTREKILLNRSKYHEIYPDLERNHVIDIDEAMIYGRAGDPEKARQILQQRYDSCSELDKLQQGHRRYLREMAQRLGIPLTDN